MLHALNFPTFPGFAESLSPKLGTYCRHRVLVLERNTLYLHPLHVSSADLKAHYKDGWEWFVSFSRRGNWDTVNWSDMSKVRQWINSQDRSRIKPSDPHCTAFVCHCLPLQGFLVYKVSAFALEKQLNGEFWPKRELFKIQTTER